MPVRKIKELGLLPPCHPVYCGEFAWVVPLREVMGEPASNATEKSTNDMRESAGDGGPG